MLAAWWLRMVRWRLERNDGSLCLLEAAVVEEKIVECPKSNWLDGSGTRAT